MILMSQTSGKDLTTQMASLTLKKKKKIMLMLIAMLMMLDANIDTDAAPPDISAYAGA